MNTCLWGSNEMIKQDLLFQECALKQMDYIWDAMKELAGYASFPVAE